MYNLSSQASAGTSTSLTSISRPGANCLLIEISEEAARILKKMRPELSKLDQG